MINCNIVHELDQYASNISQSSFSQDIYDLDETMWSFVRYRQAESGLITFTDFDSLAVVTNATEIELRRLYSGVTLSFAPTIEASDLINALTVQTEYQLKYPQPEICSFVYAYWVLVKSVAKERGPEITSLVFGLPTEVVSLISSYNFRAITALSRSLEISFELRYKPQLLMNIIGSNDNDLGQLSSIMNRVQQSLSIYQVN